MRLFELCELDQRTNHRVCQVQRASRELILHDEIIRLAIGSEPQQDLRRLDREVSPRKSRKGLVRLLRQHRGDVHPISLFEQMPAPQLLDFEQYEDQESQTRRQKAEHPGGPGAQHACPLL